MLLLTIGSACSQGLESFGLIPFESNKILDLIG